MSINFLACDHPETAGQIVEVQFLVSKNFEQTSIIFRYRFIIQCRVCTRKQVISMAVENENSAMMLGRIMSRQFDLEKRGFNE